MKKRIITGIVMLLLMGPFILMPNPQGTQSNTDTLFFVFFIIFQVGCGVLCVIGTHELLRMFETEKPMSKVAKGVAYFLSVAIFLNLGNYWGDITATTVPLLNLGITNLAFLLFGMFLLLATFLFDKEFTPDQLGKVLLAVGYVGFGMSAIVLIKAIGIRFMIYVLLITVCTDMFAYFIGIAIGKHKMAPEISPKKSWEGAIGGTVIATVIASCFALLYGHIFPTDGWLGEFFNPNGYRTIFDGFSAIGGAHLAWQIVIIVFMTIFGSAATQIGDLVASKLKRAYDIKDFGNLFPGHGGVLDRFDSIIFVSMVMVGLFLTIQGIFPAIVLM